MTAGRGLAASLALCVAFGAGAQPVAAIDDAGSRIELARPAQRIVSLAPHLTEQLFAIGAGARIVGTTEFADHPDEAKRIPRVARAHSVDLERVAALEPDLIAVWGSGFPPAVLEALRRLGAPVFVSEPKSLADIAGSLERLGTLTASAGAGAAAAAFRARLDALRARYSARRPVTVFYQIWPQPLMTLSGRHALNEAIRVCGGRNVFEDLAPIAPQVSVEAVLAADPQVIVTAEPGGRRTDALDGWKRFPSLRAVRAGRLVTLDADRINRHTPRLLDELAVLCERIDQARSRR
ncbi:MAG: cobalamin-binding protein [Betaproteobacteria bacterium]|nr:MAG: cobalamin-binding protein [Betaproteobacteria bacterium]